ncbi:hypothetical protein TorRG33x02_060360 [Trema orientale]|uniref:Uncharacterized protein n=1 Tax=Trema orientale TaxID=63057 RepID=A0A2P5FKC0_TREOI|nr:hypothetical protein TorRG33x02_060360 [Trema orientale]
MALATSHLHYSSTNINIPLNYYCPKIGLENRIINRPRKILASKREAGGLHDHRKNHGGGGGGGSVVDENMILMGLFQAQMMKSRPSLVLGVMVLILLGVPTCSAVVLFHFVEIAQGLVAGGTLG